MSIYSSREPFNVWVSEVTGQRYANPPKYGHGRYFVEKQPQNNPTNPILVAAREDFDLAPEIPEQRHPGHVDHARKVLTRLAALKGKA
jgi:hypothetical protein